VRGARVDPDAAALCFDEPAGDRQAEADAFAPQSYDPRRKGIGLGLSIARRLVEAQGGRIWIDASAPHGTVVRFTVPTTLSESESLKIGVAS